MLNDIDVSVYQASSLASAPVVAPYVADPSAPAPHPFESQDGSGTCMCGSDISDPIHIMLIVPASMDDEDYEDPADILDDSDGPQVLDSHPYMEDPGNPGFCMICGLPMFAPEHAVDHGWNDPEDGTDFCISCGNDIFHEFHVNSVPLTAAAPGTPGVRFTIPVLIPGDAAETGDGRFFASNSLTVRDVPLPLKWQIFSNEAHNQSVVVGKIDHIEMLPDSGIGNVSGVFDTSKYANECVRMIRAGMLRGVSADLDKFNASVLSQPEPNQITSQKIQVDQARLSGATIVSISAFSEAYIELVDEEDQMFDGEYLEDTPETLAASLVASAIPVDPPSAWFENPKLVKPTHLTVLDNGKVFGHIATWKTNHIGLPFGTRPPRSSSNYAYFRTGSLRTAEGTDVRVGQISLVGGHAPLSFSSKDAVAHYDNTDSAMCDLVVGEDRHGIWVSGALRPGVTPEKLRAFRASSPSGDWRPINGKLEMVAVCAVNVPGFPVAEARVASGMVVALVAAGAVPKTEDTDFFKGSNTSRQDIVNDVLMQIELNKAAESLSARLAPFMQAKEAALTAAAQSAMDVINARRAELDEQANNLVARVAALHYTGGGEFDEKKHPRDNNGRFRSILAHLTGLLGKDGNGGTPQERKAVDELKSAVDADNRGDSRAADRAADAAASSLKGSKHESVAGDIKQAKAHLANDPGAPSNPVGSDNADLHIIPGKKYSEQPAEIQRIIDAVAVTHPEARDYKEHATEPTAELIGLIERYIEHLILPAGATRIIHSR